MADLPDDPDLGWLRKRAKEISREHPDWKLADAQLHLARHYGFPSWPKLKRYVELVRSYRRAPDEVPEQARPEDEFLRLACLTYGQDDPQRQARAAGMLADEPTLGADDIWVAATRCDVDGLRRLLEDNSELASREGGPFEWAPLAYLAYARHAPDVSEAATLASAQLLLDHGADPDTGYLWHGLPSPFTALTGCFGEGEGGPGNQPAHPHGLALARLLLEAGADANDAQTLYNRMFRPDDSHLRLLFEFGLGTGDGGPWKRRLGRAAMGPAEMLAGQLAWAVLHGMDARVELLAAHGVDLDTKLDDFGGAGRTAHEAATVSGHADTAELLLRLGASPGTLGDDQRLVAAVLAADRAEVERLVAADPGLLARALEERRGLVAWAAAHAGLDAVRLAIELGWDVNRRARTDVPLDQEWETGLHDAAANGDVEMVRLLLALGADPTLKDCRFDGTPLDWAEHFNKLETAALLREISDRSG